MATHLSPPGESSAGPLGAPTLEASDCSSLKRPQCRDPGSCPGVAPSAGPSQDQISQRGPLDCLPPAGFDSLMANSGIQDRQLVPQTAGRIPSECSLRDLNGASVSRHREREARSVQNACASEWARRDVAEPAQRDPDRLPRREVVHWRDVASRNGSAADDAPPDRQGWRDAEVGSIPRFEKYIGRKPRRLRTASTSDRWNDRGLIRRLGRAGDTGTAQSVEVREDSARRQPSKRWPEWNANPTAPPALLRRALFQRGPATL